MSQPPASPVVLVTGSSSGLGAAMAAAFAANGCRVVGASRGQPDKPPGSWVQADLTLEADRRRLIDQTLAEHDRLDVLINNAGMGLYDTWANTSVDAFRRLLELNVVAMHALTLEALPALRASRGSIVNTASIAGRMPVACMGAYCATKYAVCAYSDTLRMELAGDGIHVLNLIVGRIPTDFSARSMGAMEPPETPSFGDASPEGLARATYRAWQRRRRQLVYPWWYRLLRPIPVLFPGLYTALNRRKWGL